MKVITLVLMLSFTVSLHPEAGRTTHPGLTNCGNSCYMNAALQCLTNIGPLTQFLLNPGAFIPSMTIEKIYADGSLQRQYTEMLKEMEKRANENDDNTKAPTKFLESRFLQDFYRNMQQTLRFNIHPTTGATGYLNKTQDSTAFIMRFLAHLEAIYKVIGPIRPILTANGLRAAIIKEIEAGIRKRLEVLIEPTIDSFQVIVNELLDFLRKRPANQLWDLYIKSLPRPATGTHKRRVDAVTVPKEADVPLLKSAFQKRGTAEFPAQDKHEDYVIALFEKKNDTALLKEEKDALIQARQKAHLEMQQAQAFALGANKWFLDLSQADMAALAKEVDVLSNEAIVREFKAMNPVLNFLRTISLVEKVYVKEHTTATGEAHQTILSEFFSGVVPLVIPPAMGGVAPNLKLFLRDSLQEEMVEMICDKCGGADNKIFKQKVSFRNLPHLLILAPNRFLYGGGTNKINYPIAFPMQLTLVSPRVIPEDTLTTFEKNRTNEEKAPAAQTALTAKEKAQVAPYKDTVIALSNDAPHPIYIYDLTGFVEHGGAHYWAYAKDYVTGKWGYFNDSTANLVAGNEATIKGYADSGHEGSPYVFFYQLNKEATQLARIQFQLREQVTAVSNLKAKLETVRNKLEELKEKLTEVQTASTDKPDGDR